MKLHMNRKKRSKVKRFISLALVCCLTLSMGSSYVRAGEMNPTQVNGGSAEPSGNETDSVPVENQLLNEDSNIEETPTDATPTPDATEEPTDATPMPETTEEPADATPMPEATATPTATDAPETTATPAATEVPKATDAPAATDAPETTASPEPTDAPETTTSPEPTDAPAIVAPEEEPEDFSGLLTEEQMLDVTVLAARSTMYKSSRAKISTQSSEPADGSWSFDAYYVNQSDRYNVTQTDNFNLKYQMEFHASQDLAPGAVLIRIKKELYQDRYGKSVEPTEIGVPQGRLSVNEDGTLLEGQGGYQENRSTPFNYFYDGEYLVFFNYRKISSGTNAAWQVLYKNQKLMDIIDETPWTLTPGISVDTNAKEPTAESETRIPARPYGTNVTYQETMPLTGKTDSSVSITSVIKTPYSESGKNYTPGLYTRAQVERYIGVGQSLSGEFIDPNDSDRLNTAEWRFVVWDVKVKGAATQPWIMEVLDTPSVGGDGTSPRVVGYRNNSDSTQYKVPVEEPSGSMGWTPLIGRREENLTTGNTTFADEKYEESWGNRFWVVTAYPADSVAPGTVLQNDISIRLVPVDQKDDDVVKAATPSFWSYKDYDWSYTGDILGLEKETDETVYTGWLDVYRQHSQIGEDYGDMPFRITGAMHGYSYTHVTESEAGTVLGDYIPGTYYTMTTMDDFMYAFPTHDSDPNQQVMMDGDDYYFSSVTIQQTDYGYDIWEDEKRDSDLMTVNQDDLPAQLRGGRSEVRIYAMLADPVDPNQKDVWTLIDTVYLNAQGNMEYPYRNGYSFSDDVIAQHPWRVKVEHDSIDFESVCTINVNVRLKALSSDETVKKNQVMNRIVAAQEDKSRNDKKSPVVRFENLAGAVGVAYDADGHIAAVAGDAGTGGNYKEPGLKAATESLYQNAPWRTESAADGNMLPMRKNAFRDATWLNETAYATKESSSTNDVDNNRVLVDYYLTAYDGYEIYDRSSLDYLKKEDQTLISPGRNHVVFYDLLPYGMQFDASYPVTAGRVSDLSSDVYQTQPRSWDKTQVSVTVRPEDIQPNYRGTGRTMVAFRIAFSGADSTSYTAQKWIEGWGVSFRAYYEWKDIDQMNKVDINSNIAAFMPDFSELSNGSNDGHYALCGLKSEVDYDDGTHGDEDEGTRDEVEAAYDYMVREYTYTDENGNEITVGRGNIDNCSPKDVNDDSVDSTYRNVLYAKNSLKDDVAISTTSKIEKLVHADSDRLGTFGQTATVPVGGTADGLYTYDITVTAGGSTNNIVVFDRLEKAAVDRGKEDPFYPFDKQGWSGTFHSIDTSGLDLVGTTGEGAAAPYYTVYYSAYADAPVPAEGENPREILNRPVAKDGTEDGSEGTRDKYWYSAADFEAKYGSSEGGWESQVKAVAVDMGDYTLEAGHSLSFRIKMKAPQLSELADPQNIYTYNNASFSSTSTGGAATGWKRVDGNSVRVGISKMETLEIVKRTAGVIPEALADESFEFRLYEEYTYEGRLYKENLAYTEYTLFRQNAEGGWDEQTDQVYSTDGSGYLYLHADEKAVFEVANVGRIQVKETDNVFWESRTAESVTGDVHTKTVTNTYRPVLYVQKRLSAVPEGMTLTEEDKIFTFQIKANGKALAGAEYWKVDSVRLNGAIPKKLETEGEDILRTDSEGKFTIKEGEIIALFPGVAGTEYEINEIAPDEDWNWLCEEMTLTGTLPAGGASRIVTNYYRWKDLLLKKEITHQTKGDYDNDPDGSQPFTFRISEVLSDGRTVPVNGKEWVLLDDNDTETEGAGTGETEQTEETGAGSTGTVTSGTLQNGEFTCAFGFRTVRIKGLEAGKAYLIEELTTGIRTDVLTGKPLYVPENDTLEVTMPVYSSERKATFTNDYQKRPLSVTKTVVGGTNQNTDAESRLSRDGGLNLFGGNTAQVNGFAEEGMALNPDDQVPNVESNTGESAIRDMDMAGDAELSDGSTEVKYYYFTATRTPVMANGTKGGSVALANGTKYTVTKPGAPDEVREVEDGKFKLADGETAFFKDFGMLGDEFTVTEEDNANQIFPANGFPYQGTLSGDGGEANFVNGMGSQLIISKEYIAADGVTAEDKAIADEFINKWKENASNLPEKKVKLVLEVKVGNAPYTRSLSATIINMDGETRPMQITPGEEFEVEPWETITIAVENGGLSRGLIISRGIPQGATYTLREAEESQHRVVSYEKAEGEGTQEYAMQISQSASSDALAVAKTVAERPVATIYNEVNTVRLEGNRIYKAMTLASSEVPEGSVLMWRVEKYDTDSAGWIPAEGISYVVYSGDEIVSDRVQTTLEDGRIPLVKDAGGYPSIWFTENEVFLNLYGQEEIENLAGREPLLRLVEVSEESDREWGILAGYCYGDINSTSLEVPDGIWPSTFVNSNKETAVEVEKSMKGDSETAFTMILKQVLSIRSDEGSAGIVSEDDIVASEPRDGIPYSIHNADGSLAGTGETGVKEEPYEPNGEFKLYAGQYVRLYVPEGTMWTVSEKTAATPNYTLAGLSPDPGSGKLKKLNENLMLINLPAVKQYTLKYDSNGGTGGPGTVIQAGNNTFTIPSLVPTKDGYDCVGWSDAPGGDVAYAFGGSVTISEWEYEKTIYAVWKPQKTYTVTYTDGVEGETVFADQGYMVKEGDKTPAFVGTPIREGYEFMDWSPAVKDKVVGSMANEDGEIIYTATWQKKVGYRYIRKYYEDSEVEDSVVMPPFGQSGVTGCKVNYTIDFQDTWYSRNIKDEGLCTYNFVGVYVNGEKISDSTNPIVFTVVEPKDDISLNPAYSSGILDIELRFVRTSQSNEESSETQ